MRFLGKYPNCIDLSDTETAVSVGEEIHQAWLSRNEWAKGGELGVSFLDSPPVEQDKDLAQVRTALEVL